MAKLCAGAADDYGEALRIAVKTARKFASRGLISMRRKLSTVGLGGNLPGISGNATTGQYWSATERRLVGHESLLELSRLTMIDFDRSAIRIASQPFRLRVRKDDRRLRRIPDYLVCTHAGPIVIDVTRRARMEKPEFRQKLDWTRRVVESRGWRYEILHEPLLVEFTNLRFLAGYRRSWLFSVELLDAVRNSARVVQRGSISEILSNTALSKALATVGLMQPGIGPNRPGAAYRSTDGTGARRTEPFAKKLFEPVDLAAQPFVVLPGQSEISAQARIGGNAPFPPRMQRGLDLALLSGLDVFAYPRRRR